MSRVYHSACLERGQSYWDYENFRLSSLRWEDVDRYEVNGRLGFGRFSEVMEGVEVDSGRKVVLKVLKPARSYKIKREIRVLQASHAPPFPRNVWVESLSMTPVVCLRVVPSLCFLFRSLSSPDLD